MPTLAEIREGVFAVFLNVPYHTHLGIVFDTAADAGTARVSIPPKPEIIGPDGQHSVATVFALGEIASSVEVCEAIAPRALDLGLGAVLFTLGASFSPRGPARGVLTASVDLLNRLDEGVGGENEPKKGTIKTSVKVFGEDGELVGEQRLSFYVRFMEWSRVQEMAPAYMEIVRVLES